MALKKCPECGHEISDQALFCPKCGYRTKKTELYISVFISALFIILTCIVISLHVIYLAIK